MQRYFDLVTFSHTLFALPFALLGFTLAVAQPTYAFEWLDLALVIACMVTARSAAMAFNRLVDAPIDAANPRTAGREIPAGRVSRTSATVFVFVNAAVFVLCAGLLNPLCLALSPVALAVVLGYSYTKRFTWLCHVVLGVGLALAPIGAYLAVAGAFATLPVLYGVVVLTWVAGFDVIYALQDRDFDRAHGLRSIPGRFGVRDGLRIARALHVICSALLVACTLHLTSDGAQPLLAWGAAGAFAFALVYQHVQVRGGDLTRIDRAFFTANGYASLAYAALAVASLRLGGGWV